MARSCRVSIEIPRPALALPKVLDIPASRPRPRPRPLALALSQVPVPSNANGGVLTDAAGSSKFEASARVAPCGFDAATSASLSNLHKGVGCALCGMHTAVVASRMLRVSYSPLQQHDSCSTAAVVRACRYVI